MDTCTRDTAVTIGDAQYVREGTSGILRAVACADGHSYPLVYSAAAGQLEGNVADALMMALLLPAMRLGRPLQVDGSVSPQLHRNLPRIQTLYRQFSAQCRPIEVRCDVGTPPVRPEPRGVGCFFSGGVDSYYTLFKHFDEITHLIHVENFGFAAAPNLVAALQQHAQDLGKPLVPIFTNTMQFTTGAVRSRGAGLKSSVGWWLYHGSVLASVGLLLSHRFHKVYVPASHDYRHLMPWGTHPLLDPLWGVEGLEFIHDGCEMNRAEKVGGLVPYDMAWRHLQVCPQSDGRHNCGICEKCVRTRVILEAYGVANRCTTFGGPLPLWRVAWARPSPKNVESWLDAYEVAVKQGASPRLLNAIRMFLMTSEAASCFLVARYKLRRAAGWLGEILRSLR